MKKLLCTFAAAAFILAGCGNQNVAIVDNTESDGIYSRSITETTQITKAKRQQPTITESDGTITETTPDTTTVLRNSDKNIDTTLSYTSSTINSDIPETDTVNGNDNNSENETTKADETDKTNESSTTTAIVIAEQLYYLDGIVYEVTDKYILIKETDFDMVNITVSDNSIIADINVGDTVEITYDGIIEDGDISYAHDAYSVEVTEKAEKVYTLKKFDYNDMAYSLLMPDDWSSKVIEYPQEGDFTDWGIRFTPENSSGSMDISWHSSFQTTLSMTKISKPLYGRQVTEYSQSGIWRFIAFDNGYMAANNFTDSSQYEEYAEEMDFMLSTLEFIE